jgi:DNA invertase Pin-like site-specific DNA recombinase
MSADPHDQLLLQIRGAVAEYERTLIAERMRRGRLAKMRAGALLPWTRPPFGYRLDPDRPAMRLRSGSRPARRCWSRSCSTGICSRGQRCISSPGG